MPGLIAPQHSGDGKANQYLLRGFNLDHGTDFRFTVAGVPVNLPSHGHGQGYADLNFLIPELIERLEYKKGSYYPTEGDFSVAGAANISYFSSLLQNIVQLTAGQYDYYRGLLAGSSAWMEGTMLGALELLYNDGPWVNPSHYRKLNGILRYRQGDGLNGFNLTAIGYYSKWNATDQIPRRAVEERLISLFGAIDPSNGGETHRYSLSGEWHRTDAATTSRASTYVFNKHYRK